MSPNPRPLLSSLAALLLAAGCRPPDVVGPATDTDPTAIDSDDTGPGGTDTSTSGTSTSGTTAPPDCTPDGSGPVRSVFNLVFEDFDLLADGRMVTGANEMLMISDGIEEPGEPVGWGIGANPTGVRALASGLVASADVAAGGVHLVDPSTGGVTTIASGLSNPNGLAASVDGPLYVSEHASGGRILRIDPSSGEVTVVTREVPSPNGLALDAAETVLYVASGPRIYRVSLGDGAVEVLADLGEGDYTAVATDRCGNVYTVEYHLGALLRLSEGREPELLAQLDGCSAHSGLRFGNGTDGLPREHLFASCQHTGFDEVDVGIEGIPYPYDR